MPSGFLIVQRLPCAALAARARARSPRAKAALEAARDPAERQRCVKAGAGSARKLGFNRPMLQRAGGQATQRKQ